MATTGTLKMAMGLGEEGSWWWSRTWKLLWGRFRTSSETDSELLWASCLSVPCKLSSPLTEAFGNCLCEPTITGSAGRGCSWRCWPGPSLSLDRLGAVGERLARGLVSVLYQDVHVHGKVMNLRRCYSETGIDSCVNCYFGKYCFKISTEYPSPLLQVQVHFLKRVFKSIDCVKCLQLWMDSMWVIS